MKSFIVNFLVHILSKLIPLEDHLNAALRKAAASRMIQDAEIGLKIAEKRALGILNMAHAQAASLQELAKADYAAQVASAKTATAAALVLTAQSAQALVATVQAALPAA